MKLMGMDFNRKDSLLNAILLQHADSIRLDISRASRGCLVVLEGIDGTGKSTLAQALGDELSAHLEETVIVTQEPTERFKGFQELEELLAIHPGHPSGYVDGNALTSLKFTLDHAIHLADVIIPALADNRVVICDRWTPFSSRAYQGPVASVLTQDWDITPDMTFLLTLSPEVAMKRLGKRPDGQLKCFEKMETLTKAQEVYREMADGSMHWHPLDAQLPQEVLLHRATQIIMHNIINKRR